MMQTPTKESSTTSDPSLSQAVCPGQRLGHVEDFLPGQGTYVRKNYIYASTVGYKDVQIQSPKQVLNVIKEREPTIVPEMHSIVVGRITKVNPRFATVAIFSVGNKMLKEPYSGMIRTQDVRATEIDKVEIYKCFRPGDIVKAEVISLGDSRSYILSTAKNEYGVIYATSVAGATMIPVSWELMQCPKTKMKEFRKVAKAV